MAVARAAMPSRRPAKLSPSVVVALTLTRASSSSRSSAMRRRMASRWGAMRGASQSRVTSTLPIVPPRARTCLRASATKMLTNVAGADGAKHRVGEGVQGHVGVGMTLKRLGVGDAHAAEPDVVARHEPVHVKALTDAHADSQFGHGEVLRDGEFGIGSTTQNEADR